MEGREVRVVGSVTEGRGEAGDPALGDYRCICRALAVDPRTGNVYASTSEGDIWCYTPGQSLEKLSDGDNLRRAYFGTYQVDQPGSMVKPQRHGIRCVVVDGSLMFVFPSVTDLHFQAYNWRQIVWCEAKGCFFGVHGNSGYLFSFTPSALSGEKIKLLDRLTSSPSRAMGMSMNFHLGDLLSS